MPKKPLVVSFPVLSEADVKKYLYDKGARGRVIMLQMQPIPDARPFHAPSNCHVIGMDEKGRLWRFTIPMKLWEDCRRNPVYFVEGADARGPGGSITANEANAKIVVD